MYLGSTDYAVTAIILLIPLLIGFFYAWKDAKNLTREEYLLGGRAMSMLPVSLSIFVTYQSAISLIGIPSEVYLYGFIFTTLYLGIGISFLIGIYIMIPLMYPLRLTSMFEYLEMRYQSKAVRKLATITGMLQTFFYMIIAMLAPGLAIQAAAGTPFWLSVVVVGCIGTFYTAIGGIKSVIWTDAFQTTIVFIGILIILIFGAASIGFKQVYEIANAGGRTSIKEVGLDPRIRHSWWNLVIGGGVMWMTNIFNQSTLMRLSSMKSMSSAKLAYVLNVPISILYGVLLGLVGIVLYAYFYTISCDPVGGGLVSNANQVILFYIIHIFQDYPGLAGLYLATIFSGAISTLSSGINALAAMTIEDILGERFLRGFTEKTITTITKVIVFLYGIVIVILTYFAQSLDGPITQSGVSIIGVFGSVVLGLMVVGFTVPWANKYGAFVGALTSLIINVWISVGARLYGVRAPLLPSITTEGCSTLYYNQTIVFNTENTTFSHSKPSISPPVDVNMSNEYGFFLYDISYMWYTLFGVIINASVNLVVSKLTRPLYKAKPDTRLIVPFLRGYWKLETIVTPDPNEYSLTINSNGH